ncbi:MAG: DUF167 domain-containing protein [Gemmatimonadales bacterium]|nr:DUF167 domain-containing protein [Gemmatimonadales bacterium]
MSWIAPIPGGIRLLLHIQPRAARTEAVGRHGDALKIRLAAPPVDGAANAALVRWLAEVLDVPAGAVTVVRGATSRRKVVEVRGVSSAEAGTRLGAVP